MSEEQLKAFLEVVKTNPALQEKLEGASDLDGVVMIARAAGFMISVDDLQQGQEVSDAVLEGVAGGAGCIPLAFNGFGGLPTTPV